MRHDPSWERHRTPHADDKARALLIKLGSDVASIVDGLDRDADLQLAGVDSANIIELGLMIEDELDVALSASELDSLGTIAGIATVIETTVAIGAVAVDTDSASSVSKAQILSAIEHAYEELTARSKPMVPTMRLADDLNLNSLQRYELLITLEEAWEVELVDHADIARVQTVGDLVDLIAMVLAGQ